MATYIPNAADSTQPTEDKPVESAALEFRTLKAQEIRGVRFPSGDTSTNRGELPAAASRAGKFLAFDAVTGKPAVGPDIAAWTITQTQIGQISTVATNIAAVNTAATNIVAIQEAPAAAVSAAASAEAAQDWAEQAEAIVLGDFIDDTTISTLKVWSSSKTAAEIALRGDVFTGDVQTLSNKTIVDPVLTGGITEDVFALTGTTPAFALANGSIQTWTLTANSTPTNSLTSGQALTLMITAGTYTVTWPSVSWVGGSAPTLSVTAKSVIQLWQVGSSLYGAFVGAVA